MKGIYHDMSKLFVIMIETTLYISISSDDHQLAVLQQSFAINQFARQDTITNLSKVLGMSVSKVYNWFIDERNRVRKRKPSPSKICKLLIVTSYT